jgi:hypothetical protein
MHSEHLRHDRLLIARYAADDSYASEVDEARAQIAACTDCAALADDIRLVSRSMATVPVPARPRDFRITADQAERLRGSWLERVMRRFAAPGLGTLRPVAGVAMSIGLVMAIAGALPSFAPAGPAADVEIGFPADSARPLENAPAPAQAEATAKATGGQFGSEGMGTPAASMDVTSGAPMGPDSPLVTATDGGGTTNGEGPGDAARSTLEPMTLNFDNAHSSPGADEERLSRTELDDSATNTSSLLTYGGILIALMSLGLLVVAGLARRRYSDRLLR